VRKPAETVRNDFVHRAAAERYREHRPYFHPRFVEEIRQRLRLKQPLPEALDVGCGTGQSAVALRAIARQVTATDISQAMLSAAPPAEGICYLCAPAEDLPLASARFPLITVSMAFHWFDRRKFLGEAARLLSANGWLVLYGYNYTKVMVGVPAFTEWFEQKFLVRYPLGPRHGPPVSEEDLAPHMLSLIDRTAFTETRDYTVEGYARTLLTHSNVIHQIEGGAETLKSATAWIEAGLRPFFAGAPARALEFSGWAAWIQKRQAS